MRSLPDNVVAFIDNAEDRMVIEYDAEWYEETFTGEHVPPAQHALGHIFGADALKWKIARVEYTGEKYILTIEHVGVV